MKNLKNSQKGFVAPLLIAIIAVLLIGGGVYVYQTQRTPALITLKNTNENKIISDTSVVVPVVSTSSNVTTSVKTGPIVKKVAISVSGLSTTISQNSTDLAEARANLTKIAAQYKSMGSSNHLVITAPTGNNVLEPGKPVTVIFSPEQGASRYEISITKPAWADQAHSSISADKVDVLFKGITSNTEYTFVVPQTDAIFLSENTYNGEILYVKALDSQGNVIDVIHSQAVGDHGPAIAKQQIKILPNPTQPELLKADKYVIGENGGNITLIFGALPAKFNTRKVTLICSAGGTASQVSIDNIECSGGAGEGSFKLGSASYTKTLVVNPNIFGKLPSRRDTSFAIRVQYLDSTGIESNPASLDTESWISIKISK